MCDIICSMVNDACCTAGALCLCLSLSIPPNTAAPTVRVTRMYTRLGVFCFPCCCWCLLSAHATGYMHSEVISRTEIIKTTPIVIPLQQRLNKNTQTTNVLASGLASSVTSIEDAASAAEEATSAAAAASFFRSSQISLSLPTLSIMSLLRPS